MRRYWKKALAALVFGGGFGLAIKLVAGFGVNTWQYWVLLVVGCLTQCTSLFGNED